MMSFFMDASITLSPHLHFNGMGRLFYGGSSVNSVDLGPESFLCGRPSILLVS